MQRMKLHVSGVKVPKLGTMQDRVMREYLYKTAQLEIKRTEFMMLAALTGPNLLNPNDKRSWASSISKSWRQYMSLEYNLEMTEHTERELELIEYYTSTVKNAKLQIRVDEKGTPVLNGLETMG